MLDHLFVMHKVKNKQKFAVDSNALHWSTCLRDLVIGHRQYYPQQKNPQWEEFNGVDAYAFLLEIACGLHSPIVGETEIMGQFKEFFQQNLKADCQHSKLLELISSKIIQDAKKVRTDFLKGLGCRSYGSISRQFLKQEAEISIVGSGKIVQEILPWLYKDRENIKLFCRNLHKAKQDFIAYPKLEIMDIDSALTNNHAALIIAAPIKIDLMHNCKKIIDLRGEFFPEESLPFDEILRLDDLFAMLEDQKLAAAEQIIAAKSCIQSLSLNFFRKSKHRPFGWDDICA